MSNCKRIKKFFNADEIQVKGTQGETIHHIKVLRMVQIDMVFLFFGAEQDPTDGSRQTYLYQTKEMVIQNRFRIHNSTKYIDKVVNDQSGLKLLVSVGEDYQMNEQQTIQDKVCTIKVWLYLSLITESYTPHHGLKLTGGSIWERNPKETPDISEAPRIITIFGKDGKAYKDKITQIRVSPDGVFIGVVLLKDAQIKVFQLMTKTGEEHLPIKQAEKPYKTIQFQPEQMDDIIDLFFYRVLTTGSTEYCLYVFSKRSVVMHYLDRPNGKPITVLEGPTLTPGSIDAKFMGGKFIVDTMSKNMKEGGKEEHDFRIFNALQEKEKHSVEGQKKFIRFFGDYVVEVKNVLKHGSNESKGEQLVIYDFDIEIQLFWTTPHSAILQVEIENDAIYYLAENNISNDQRQKVLYKLFEFENNVKIQTLMKSNIYDKAVKIASKAKFPDDIIAEINKEAADKEYGNQNYENALALYIKTIGHLNPSYVIQRYIQVSQLNNLINYLSVLIHNTDVYKQTNSVTNVDYNKDYTALLLNCYMKKEQFDKISELIKNDKNKVTIFDAATAIDVCRQNPKTLVEATKLAQDTKQWRLLIQINIENNHNYKAALDIIQKEVENLKDKVECLQLYGPKLLSEFQKKPKAKYDTKNSKMLNSGGNKNIEKEQENKKSAESLFDTTKLIVDAIIDIESNPDNREVIAQKHKFQIRGKQKVMIEDLLQVFVDHQDFLKKFLKYVIDKYGDSKAMELMGGPKSKISGSNLYHRLLECYLFKHQELSSTNASMAQKQAFQRGLRQQSQVDGLVTPDQNKKAINELINKHDGEIDRHYVLFLFQIYNYSEGVKECCNRLNLKQELLNFYISNNQSEEVLQVCRDTTIASFGQEGGSSDSGELWIQALTYFRDLPVADIANQFISQALEFIGSNNVLSPLLVLEILQEKKELKFSVIKKFMMSKLKSQTKTIKEKKKKVEDIRNEIVDCQLQTITMKTTAINFEHKECAECHQPLQLPTINFTCGHTYHEFCIDAEGIRRCTKCDGDFQQVLELKKHFDVQACNSEQFFKELDGQATKFNTIATYFGMDLFSKIDANLQGGQQEQQ